MSDDGRVTIRTLVHRHQVAVSFGIAVTHLSMTALEARAFAEALLGSAGEIEAAGSERLPELPPAPGQH